MLTVPEIFLHSSNIGTAKMALEVGIERHQEFLRRVGLFDRLQTELPESAKPLLPRQWSKLATATAAFGHGFAVQPLQGVAVVCGLLNGGNMMTPTLLKRDRADAEAHVEPDRLSGDQRENALPVPSQCRRGHGVAMRTFRLPRRRQNRHGGKGRQWPLRQRQAAHLVHRRISHGLAALCAAGHAGRAECRRPRHSASRHRAGTRCRPAGKIIERIAPILGVDPVLSDKDRAKLEKQAKAEKAKR